MVEFLAANWLWIAAIAMLVAMHRGGHGCGMHGRHQHRSDEPDTVDAHDEKGERSTS